MLRKHKAVRIRHRNLRCKRDGGRMYQLPLLERGRRRLGRMPAMLRPGQLCPRRERHGLHRAVLSPRLRARRRLGRRVKGWLPRPPAYRHLQELHGPVRTLDDEVRSIRHSKTSAQHTGRSDSGSEGTHAHALRHAHRSTKEGWISMRLKTMRNDETTSPINRSGGV